MAIYDGETVRLKATVTDFNGASVDNTGVTGAKVSLYDPSGNYVFQNQDLTYNSVDGYWYFDWQEALPGTFTSLYVFEGSQFEVFEYGTIRVKHLKVEPSGLPTPITNDPNDP